jgi:hypothetical protein
VPERPRAAALVAGFGGSLSSAAVDAGELVNRCSESSRAEASSCCGEGLMVGVGVLMAWSCTCWEEYAEERCSDAVFSGEIDLARSCHEISKVNGKSGTTSRVAPRTCTAR